MTEFRLPAPPKHLPQQPCLRPRRAGGSSRIWLDDSLSNQVGVYNHATNQVGVYNLKCGVHPHDRLKLDPALYVQWDEEFDNALG